MGRFLMKIQIDMSKNSKSNKMGDKLTYLEIEDMSNFHQKLAHIHLFLSHSTFDFCGINTTGIFGPCFVDLFTSCFKEFIISLSSKVD